MFLRVTMLKVFCAQRKCSREGRGELARRGGVKSSFEMRELAICRLTFKPFRNNLLGGFE